MSFILDALKKSENERQGQTRLGVADVPMAVEKPRAPSWIWWLMGLLGVNLLVLLVVLLRPASENSGSVTAQSPIVDKPAPSRLPESPTSGSIVNEAGTGEPVPDTVEPAVSVPEKVAPALAAVVDRARAGRIDSVANAVPEAVSDAPPDTSPRLARSEPVSAPPSEPAAVEAGVRDGDALALPTLDELRARGETNLPDLHVDIHVYSEQPSGRFVYINTVKYREGGELAEGPRVQSIIEQGVVLQHLGTRFLLPRE